MAEPKVNAEISLTFSDERGGTVTLTPDGLERLLFKAFDVGMVRFMLDMPQSGACVANKPVGAWQWIECSSKHATVDRYDGEEAVYIHVNVDRDAENGKLKGGE